MISESEGVRQATFLQRAGAYSIDSGILLGLWFVAFLAAGGALTAVEDESTESDLIAIFIIFFGPVSWFMYQWACNSVGVSPGKKVLRLAVEPTTNAGRLPPRARPRPGTGLMRTIGQVIGAVPLGLGFWWALWDSEGRAWHDRLAGTRVVCRESTAGVAARVWDGLRRTRTKEQQQLALKEALEQEIPATLANAPLEIRLGRWWMVALQLFHVVFVLDILLLARALGWDWGLLALIGGLFLLILAGSWPELYGLTQKIVISAAGVSLERLWGSKSVPWYAVTGVQARPDLADMRIKGFQTQLTWSSSALSIDKRKGVLLAIRARLPESARVEEWTGQQLATFAPGALAGAAGVTLLFASSLLGVPAGKALGMRCSVASAYSRERFDLPNEQGCVVLRVSGAAERAGIRQGDLMIEMDGVPIVSGAQFSILFENSGHDEFEFVMIRPGQPQPLTFRVKMGPTKGPREDRSDPLFYYLRARSDTEREHIERDIQDYTRAIQMAPGFDIAYMYRGELYQERGDLEAARADYLRAIELSPDLGVAHRWLATLDQEEGDTASALRRFESGIALDKCEGGFTRYNIECAEDYLLLAGFYTGTDIEKVRPAAERSIEFYSGFAEPYYQLAVVHYFLDEDLEARRYAETYYHFPQHDVEPEKVAALEALLEESSFNCDGALEDAPHWHCPIPLETSPP